MDTIQSIYHRRAIRDFTKALVTAEDINFVINAAVQAPNAMDKQRWAFVVIRDLALLERISTEAKALTLSILGHDPTLAPFREHLQSAHFNIFYNAPVLILICGTANDAFVEHDCCLAAQNLMLAAHARGLGTCWIGFAEAWLTQLEAKKEIGIPAHCRPIAPIIFGHPNAQPPAPPRQQPDILWIEP